MSDRATPKSTLLSVFMQAATAIPLVGASLVANAQTPASDLSTEFKFAHYEEYQGAGEGRMHVNAPMAWFRSPFLSNSEVEGSVVVDSMSGASTYFLSSRTGASGSRVSDERIELDFKGRYFFERNSLGFGITFSDEDDYQSVSPNIEQRWWSEDKNTNIILQGGFSADSVSSSINDQLSEHRSSQQYLLGISQLLDPLSAIQSNITASIDNGYLSDPYKTFDHRPESRDSFAWLVQYLRYIEAADASLHLDYRFYFDSWDIQSHTFETAWYQPINETWLVKPRIRYYTQQNAKFFTGSYPPDSFDTFYSADQRLGTFGGITSGVKVVKKLGEHFSADLSFDYQYQREDLALGGSSESGIEPFSTWVILIGVASNF